MNDFVKESQSVDKLIYSALVPEFIREVVDVLTSGAKKYSLNNWKKCEDKSLYIDALFRHIEAWRMGEKLDTETGKHHLAHACCNLMFLFWMDNNEL